MGAIVTVQVGESQSTSIELRDGTTAQLERWARETGRTPAQIVAQAVTNYVLMTPPAVIARQAGR